MSGDQERIPQSKLNHSYCSTLKGESCIYSKNNAPFFTCSRRISVGNPALSAICQCAACFKCSWDEFVAAALKHFELGTEDSQTALSGVRMFIFFTFSNTLVVPAEKYLFRLKTI